LGAAQSAATLENGTQKPRTYEVRTFGCQMNVHDSERMAGMLENAGYVPADGGQADVVVFNTCAVRENADNKLYGNLGMLAPVKAANPGMQIAVGGCLAQKDRETILKKAPWVDAVFGTHNVGALPALLERARHNHEVHPPHEARLRVLGLGFHFGWLQQHLHLLHRSGPAWQGEGPPPRRHPCGDPGPR
jgi:tRNA-2-methylthio-N6-dimethylallyladenosine synthase